MSVEALVAFEALVRESTVKAREKADAVSADPETIKLNNIANVIRELGCQRRSVTRLMSIYLGRELPKGSDDSTQIVDRVAPMTVVAVYNDEGARKSLILNTGIIDYGADPLYIMRRDESNSMRRVSFLLNECGKVSYATDAELDEFFSDAYGSR